MKIAVIGAGIIGVTTAHQLAAEGHQVTVFERCSSVAEDASFGHAGLLAPATDLLWPPVTRAGLWPWRSGPKSRQGGVPPMSRSALLRWRWRHWRAGRSKTAEVQRICLRGLFSQSIERLQELEAKFAQPVERSSGCLVLVRHERQAKRMQAAVEHLNASGQRCLWVDPDQAATIEPGLHKSHALHAAIHFPQAAVANCRQFAQLLRPQAQALGAEFVFQCQVLALIPGPRPRVVFALARPASPSGSPENVRDTSGHVEARDESFDAVVLCAGFGSNALLTPLGLRLPLAPVLGTTITAPLRQSEGSWVGPRSMIVDATDGTRISRMGSRVRVAGGAALGAAISGPDAADTQGLYAALNLWFPGAAQLDRAQVWQGQAPTMPDGMPLVGPSKLAGIWLNLGHGAQGWSLACGAARLVADRVAGRADTIHTQALGIERLG